MNASSPRKTDRLQQPDKRPDLCKRLHTLRLRHYGPRGKANFAKALRLPLSTYCTYESCRLAPADILARATELTGCDLEWLLTGKIGRINTDNLSPEETGAVERMARLIAGRPEARQALEALVDLLSKGAGENVTSDNMRQAPPKQPPIQLTDRVLAPIVGRTAAGHLAFWREEEELAGLRDLRSLAEAVLAGEGESMFETEITTAGPPYAKAGSAAVVAFAESRQIGDVLVNGVVVLGTRKLGRRLVAVEIDGESMESVLYGGDYILVDTDQPAASGEIALVRVEGQIGTTCKIFLPEGDKVRLIPANAAYETAVVKKDQIRWACRVVGAVRRSTSR